MKTSGKPTYRPSLELCGPDLNTGEAASPCHPDHKLTHNMGQQARLQVIVYIVMASLLAAMVYLSLPSPLGVIAAGAIVLGTAILSVRLLRKTS